MSLFKVLPFPLDGYKRFVIGLVGDDETLLTFVQQTWSSSTGVELVAHNTFLSHFLTIRDTNGKLSWNYDSCEILTQNENILSYETGDSSAFQLAGYMGINLPPAASVPNHNMVEVD